MGKLDADGKFRPFTVAEARDRGITDYDPATGKVGPDVRAGCGGTGYEPEAK